ncbi:MAG: ABC transporter permease, partial [Alphaproteobacteria bacterium]|nr:ABC transporter permease [Alphaproteobacteria bacterium]
LFGGVTIMQLAGQARGWSVSPQFLSMLPYLATIIVLVAMSRGGRAERGAPAQLGRIFLPPR